MYDFVIKDFYTEFKNINLDALGIIDGASNIHTLGTDSKIIGRIFEMYTQPVLDIIANNNGYILETPDAQTIYPDFILVNTHSPYDKIAIDVKSTYIENSDSTIKFTLGSYGSYMRNNTKNIAYPYTSFSKHFVIGFVYKRNGHAQESQTFSYENRHKIICPFTDVSYFIQEKYKIAGDKPGSGNTENIGSFSTKNFEVLQKGLGPFSFLGEDVFELYWKNYPKYRATQSAYTSLNGFLEWFPKQIDKPQLLHDYDYDHVLSKIEKYKEMNR